MRCAHFASRRRSPAVAVASSGVRHRGDDGGLHARERHVAAAAARFRTRAARRDVPDGHARRLLRPVDSMPWSYNKYVRLREMVPAFADAGLLELGRVQPPAHRTRPLDARRNRRRACALSS